MLWIYVNQTGSKGAGYTDNTEYSKRMHLWKNITYECTVSQSVSQYSIKF